MNEQWIKQMQQKMADYKQPAPELSWDAIDKAISAGKPHKFLPLWLKGIAAAVVLLLITGVSLHILHQPEETPEQQITPISPTLDYNEQITTTNGEQPLPEMLESPANIIQTTSFTESSTPHSKSSEIKKTPVISQVVIVNDYTEEPALSDPIADETPTNIRDEQSVLPEKQARSGNFNSEIPIPTTKYNKQQTGRLMAMAYFSSSMTDKRFTETGPILLYDNDNDNLITTQNNSKTRHHLPIRFGLSLQYQIDERWSMESGLSYTLLISDITHTQHGHIDVTEQRLYYIGIPVNLGYQLWTGHRYGLYVTAGGTIDKLLNGNDWQFSLNGSAGAEYILNNRFSLYIEPGIGYYFPNGSNLSTIYNDHPLNFNINLGLRFNLK